MGLFWVFFFFNSYILLLCSQEKREKSLRKDLHDPYLQGLYIKNMQIPWSCLCSISLPLSCCHPHFPKMGESDDQMLARSPQELCEPFIMAVWLVLALRFVPINPLCKAQESRVLWLLQFKGEVLLHMYALCNRIPSDFILWPYVRLRLWKTRQIIVKKSGGLSP
jgi:hypothetical protein